jgi:hypothetical protein
VVVIRFVISRELPCRPNYCTWLSLTLINLYLLSNVLETVPEKINLN